MGWDYGPWQDSPKATGPNYIRPRASVSGGGGRFGGSSEVYVDKIIDYIYDPVTMKLTEVHAWVEPGTGSVM